MGSSRPGAGDRRTRNLHWQPEGDAFIEEGLVVDIGPVVTEVIHHLGHKVLWRGRAG